MLISGFPAVGLKIDQTLVEGGVAGCILVVGPDGELAQMLPMTSRLGHAEDDGAVLTVDGLEHDWHLVSLLGPRELRLENQEIGQEQWLIVTPTKGVDSWDLTWPVGIAWKGGGRPELDGTPGRSHLVRLIKVGEDRWLGWPDGDFF